MNVVKTSVLNLALGKKADQSSISKWSSAQNTRRDASVATNGDTTGPRFFHTDHEEAPWWQVDLGDEFVVEQLRIFNRREAADRLRRFTVLVSPTGASGDWSPVYSKSDAAIFGDVDDVPFVVAFGSKILARFVRIRKDGAGFLHFRECEVIGYQPDPEELALLRDQTERTKQRLVAEEAERTSRLVDGRTGHVAHIDSHVVFVDTEKYSPILVRALSKDGYEGGERGIVNKTLLPTDRVLEIGTAVGVVAMTSAEIVSPSHVLTYDANPSIVADARRNFAANGMGEINANVGVMRNRARWRDDEKDIDFFISRDFWASRLFAKPDDPDITDVVKVPLVCLEDKIAEHQANVLICDIEGGEADLLDGANLDSIRLIMMEVHYWAVGRPKIDSMIRYLILSGFNVNLYHTTQNLVLLDRMP